MDAVTRIILLLDQAPRESWEHTLRAALGGRQVYFSAATGRHQIPSSATWDWPSARRGGRFAVTDPGTTAGARDIERAKQILSQSGRPVIVTALGLEPDKPYAQLRQLAESLHAPVIDTPKSKGALPADHPLFAGTFGLTMTDPAYEILEESDCILAIGFDVVELVKPWKQSQPLIWISNWENEDPRIDSACEMIGNINDILDPLLD